MRDSNYERNYKRAITRVQKLRGFYIHLLVYLVVNLFVSIYKILENMRNGETFEQAFYDFATFIVWLLWGIGLIFHAFSVFGLPMILGPDWEEKKIEEFMNEEQSTNWKE